MENYSAPTNYEELMKASLGEGRDAYWKKQAEEITWEKEPVKILDESNPPFYKWYPDATLNITINCLDRWIESQGDHPALIYEGPIAGKKMEWTYSRLLEEVEKFAGVLKNKGVGKGDTVIIYMPMILESAAVMLACARVGAVHSVVFGGFAPKELAGRMIDSQAKLIVSASCGLEPHKTIHYRDYIRKACTISKIEDIQIVYVQREQLKLENLLPTETLYADEMAKAQRQKATIVKSTDPLYILYTSGTTGVPKGIVRDQGGTAVGLNLSHDLGFDL